MAYLVGTQYCKVDSNGRIKFPIALKRQFGEGDLHFVIRESIASSCLELWTEASFNEEMNFLNSRLRIYDPDDHELLVRLTSSNQVYLDGSDRLLVPPEQKHVIEGAKEVVLQSTGRYIEIWDRKVYDELKKPNSHYVGLAKRLLYREGSNGESKESGSQSSSSQ